MDPSEKKRKSYESSQLPSDDEDQEEAPTLEEITHEENEERLRIEAEIRKIQEETRKEREKRLGFEERIRKTKEEARKEREDLVRNSLGGFFHTMSKVDDNSNSPSLTITGDEVADKDIVAAPKEVILPDWYDYPDIHFQGDIQTEEDITHQVTMLLLAVIEALGLKDMLYVTRNRFGMDMAPDLLVVHKTNHLPIGTVEVKKPGCDEIEHERIFGSKPSQVNGQLFEQLSLLSLNGPKEPIGIITTWNTWQLLSLTKPFPSPHEVGGMVEPANASESEGAHESPNVDTDRQNVLSTPVARMNRESEGGSSTASELQEISGISPRLVYATAPVEAGMQVKQLIAAALLSMVRSSLDRQSILVAPFTAQARRIRFSSYSPDVNESNRLSYCTHSLPGGIQFDKCPDSETQEFFIWSPLGYGSERSYRWLATDKDGRACSIKFFRPHDTVDWAEVQAATWHAVHGPEFPLCRNEKFRIGHTLYRCLLTPYIYDVPINERQALLDNGEVEKALRKISKKGFRFDHELQWSWVGMFVSGDGSVREVTLRDLGCFSRVDARSAEEWADETLKELKKRVDEKATDFPHVIV